MYVIMRKMNGYTHFDFLRDDFMASQYFLLTQMINIEAEKEKEQVEKSKSRK